MHGALRRSTVVLGVLGLGLVAALHAAAGPGPPGGAYKVTPLVSDLPGTPLTDPDLVNAWGLTRSPMSPWWVADNGPDPGTSKSTVYTGGGSKILSVNVLGGPTGDVFAGVTGNFQIGTDTDPTALAPAKFIFATENGDLRAWQAGSTAVVAPATGIAADAKFKGLAITPPTSASPLLYAADFHNAVVDVFNGSWQNVTPHGAFVDRKLPRGYAPFGIQTIGSDVFVTYGKQDAEGGDEIDGHGLGFVDEYDLQGKLVARVAQRGQLDAPWGLAMAPASFERFKGDLLVGNFGDGQINAYAQGHGHGHGPWHHAGTLRSSSGGKLVIDGLWALEFGNAGSNGDPDTLFFTAGPNDESNGLFGTIKPG